MPITATPSASAKWVGEAKLGEGERPRRLDDEPEQRGEPEAPDQTWWPARSGARRARWRPGRWRTLTADAERPRPGRARRARPGRTRARRRSSRPPTARPRPTARRAGAADAHSASHTRISSGPDVLDHQRHADLQALDGQEVGGVHGGEPGDAQEGEAGHVAALDPQRAAAAATPRRRPGSPTRRSDRICARRKRADPVVEQEARQRPVERPHRGRGRGERVAEAGGGGGGHRGSLTDGKPRSRAVRRRLHSAATGRSAAW